MSDITLTDFRANIKQYFEAAELNPQAIYRSSKVYVLMSKQHYIDLLHKAKYPSMMQMPSGVQTIVHFSTTITHPTH
jgi:hypothetical protein